MADVFVSYKREDRARVKAIVDLLLARGWSVWWDSDLKGGEWWAACVRREHRKARCVVVAWSIRSIDPIGGRFVQSEAMRAFNTDRLIGVRIEPVGIPMPFDWIQTVNFFGEGADGKRALLEAVSNKLAARPIANRSPIWQHCRAVDLACEATGHRVRIVVATLRDGRSLRLGRGEVCDLIVPDPDKYISRVHARITFVKGLGLCISDLRSTNGTFLDDCKSAPSRDNCCGPDV